MADTVIRVEGLGKKYRLGRIRHDTLRDRFAHALSAPGRWLRRTPVADPTEFWALRDVSFEVQRGEVLGIIGRNGAGKSTLLKVLSRITEPTAGRITLDGRVASLLEVGTGFHPELSGRENVFLNGAILGMSRAEIRRKFDEIVAFAEVEKFLDTPVKHYSSGMYVRLAFAVAAHLEPEILIVDEVLAVGDAAFQQKCLGRMRQLAGSAGRTVLFVSHNLTAIQLLCARALLLDQGKIVAAGPADQVAARFEGDLFASRGASGSTELLPGLVLGAFRFAPEPVTTHQTATFELELEGPLCAQASELALFLEGPTGERVALIDLREPLNRWRRAGAATKFSARGILKSMPFVEGAYQAGLFLDCGRGLRRDFSRLCPVIVSPNAAEPASLYPAVHRGVVALEVDINVR